MNSIVIIKRCPITGYLAGQHLAHHIKITLSQDYKVRHQRLYPGDNSGSLYFRTGELKILNVGTGRAEGAV